MTSLFRNFAILLAFTVSTTSAAWLVWDLNVETNIAGYKVYRQIGTNPPAAVPVGLTDRMLLSETNYGVTVTYNVTAVNTDGLESDLSDSVLYTPARLTPITPTLTSSLLTNNGWSWGLSIGWAALPKDFGSVTYRVAVTQAGTVITNLTTTNFTASFKVPARSPTSISITASNYLGVSSSGPIVTYAVPGRVAATKLSFP